MRINHGNDAEADADPMDDFYLLKMIENAVLGLTVKGIPGMHGVGEPTTENVSIDRELKWQSRRVQECLSQKDGGNLSDVLNLVTVHRAIDAQYTVSNHVSEIFEVLGVEAARNVIISELHSVITDTCDISTRHLMLLADFMTSQGIQLISIDRNGMKRTTAGPLSKCSFEETDKLLYQAAIFAETDHVVGVSANIMLGQVPPCGTGVVQIEFDVAAYLELQRVCDRGSPGRWCTVERHGHRARITGVSARHHLQPEPQVRYVSGHRALDAHQLE
jgi:DNA-directed RNA polymerase II subunit RPB1